MSSQSQSDGEEVGSNLLCTVVEDQLEIVKHENDNREEEQTTEDIFENDIVLPHANPTNVKERRESKEKSKKELEEEEREKMQYVFNIVIIVITIYVLFKYKYNNICLLTEY